VVDALLGNRPLTAVFWQGRFLVPNAFLAREKTQTHCGNGLLRGLWYAPIIPRSRDWDAQSVFAKLVSRCHWIANRLNSACSGTVRAAPFAPVILGCMTAKTPVLSFFPQKDCAACRSNFLVCGCFGDYATWHEY
jgi:hypothetical protein